MFIGRLLLKGFKSFGASHDLELSPGFTAIVGPNGSGKSNLLDALRWALGETSLKKLRISSQKNLLFDGSLSCEAAREAEVALHLRDDGKISVIKRRVTAPDGNTALFVDNQRKTLTELDAIKRNWKLEGTKFAFIGQGEVQAALEQTPSERRMHLEVLFGIDIYRKKRTESSDRLIAVKEEFERLKNLTGELESRRREIAPSVERAAAVREIEQSIDSDRALMYHLRRAECERIALSLSREIEEYSRICDQTQKWRIFWNRAQQLIEEKTDAATKSQGNYRAELEQCRLRFDSLIKSGVSSAANMRSAAARLNEAEEEYKETFARVAEIQKEQRKAADNTRRMRKEVERAERAAADAEKKWQEYNAAVERGRQQREAWNNEHSVIEGELEKNRSKLSYLGREILELGSKLPESTAVSSTFTEQIHKLAQERERISAEQQTVVREHAAVFAHCQTMAAELQRARKDAAALRNKLNEATETLQQGMYPSPVRHLLSAAKLKRLDADPHAVIDVITADAKLAPALEAYLGGRQFQLLVEDMDEAGRCIARLKQNSAGTATFLPLERARPRYPNKLLRLTGYGIVGWAVELIKIDPHWRPAIEHILGDLLIVDNYNTGRDLVRSGVKTPIVTMEGDVFQTGGTVSGGRSQKSGRLLEMKAQIAALETSAQSAAQKVTELTNSYKAEENREIDLADAKEEYTRKIREINGRIAVIEDKKEAAAREQKRAAGEKNRIMSVLKTEGSNRLRLLEQLRELEERRDNSSDVADDRSIIEERETARAACTVAASNMSSTWAIAERIRRELENEENKLHKTEEEKNDLYSVILCEKNNLARVGGSCLEIHNRRTEITEKMERCGVDFARLGHIKKYIESRAAQNSDKLSSESERRSAATTKQTENERVLSELIANYEERYPYSDPTNLPRDVNTDALRRKIRDGERKIKAFGDVEMGVLSEDESLKSRLDFLAEQAKDVKTSIDEIERLITEADFMAYNQFTSSLVQVDKRFCELFQTLFDGGEAHLVMTEGESIWHSGVEIDARLPGKHTKVLYQYSGGERTLISISLLFATMEVAGSPIAVLDEVDAALDEANLRRFSKLTKEYAQTCQILAMTHRRATMERADVLYGVTLKEKGLSQVVGVRIDDWS